VKFSGAIVSDPATRFELACAVAGMIAESGVQELSLVQDGCTTTLPTRTTDLPSLLNRGDLELSWAHGRIAIAQSRLTWEVGSESLHTALAALGPLRLQP